MNSRNHPGNPSVIVSKKSLLFATVGLSALVIASAAYAQEAPSGPVESVTVSSSRIMSAGFNAPTPTTVLGTDFIRDSAKDTIFTTVTQLPSLLGSTGVESGVNGTSGGTNGLASFNMFGLGTIRTLTLLDSQRFMPANVTGVPDISEFPQILIQRVDVVTGGASASWGSDAIAGVVNFITDKKFVGFKANISSGLSTYGDNATLTAQVAMGTSFAGGRGHFEIAGEFSHMDGVEGGWAQLTCCGGRSDNSLSNGRKWFIEPTIVQYASPTSIPNGTPGTPTFCGTNNSCQPQYFVTANGQQNQLGRYGLINSGPLMGTAFGLNGTILLTSTLTITSDVAIVGPGAAGLIVDGQNAVRVFQVNGGVTAQISGLTIQHGNANGDRGGGILNDGTLTVTESVIRDNAAVSNGGGGIANNPSGTLAVSGLRRSR